MLKLAHRAYNFRWVEPTDFARWWYPDALMDAGVPRTMWGAIGWRLGRLRKEIALDPEAIYELSVTYYEARRRFPEWRRVKEMPLYMQLSGKSLEMRNLGLVWDGRVEGKHCRIHIPEYEPTSGYAGIVPMSVVIERPYPLKIEEKWTIRMYIRRSWWELTQACAIRASDPLHVLRDAAEELERENESS